MIWNTFTGTLKQKIQLPVRTPGAFVNSISFLKKHHNFFIVTQSNGDLYVLSPISGEAIVHYEGLVPQNANLALRENEETLVAIAENGQGKEYKIDSSLE